MSLAQLRHETGPLHLSLEKKLQLFQKVKSQEDYAGHLARLHQWLKPIEEQIAGFASELLEDWPQRKKTAWIAEDLESLGLTPPPAISFPLPPCESAAQCLGILYVLEGSSLGAQVISRHYAEALGLKPDHGLRYFTGYGEATGLKWRAFLARLEENFSKHPESAGVVIESACAAFRSYSDLVPRQDE